MEFHGEVFHTGNHRTKHIHFQIKIVKNAHHDLDHITIKNTRFLSNIIEICERFEPRSHFKSRLSLIVRVNVVLTVVVDSDLTFRQPVR